MASAWYWYKREISQDPPLIPVSSRSVNLGDGCFETIRVWNGKTLFPDQHLSRYLKSCEVLRLDALPAGEIKTVIRDLTGSSKISSGRIRITTFRKGEGVYAPGTSESETVISIKESDSTLFSAAPVSIMVSAIHRISPGVLSTVKSTSSLPFVLSAAEAREKGMDHAVLLNTSGRLADGTGFNVFIINGNQVVTPPLYEGSLPGIMRGIILGRLASDAGLEPLEREIYPGEFIGAEEIFLSNAVQGIVPVKQVEEVVKSRHQKTTRLMQSLQRVVSGNIS